MIRDVVKLNFTTSRITLFSQTDAGPEYEFPEEGPCFRRCPVHAFRMPLYTDGERVFFKFDGFHCTVFCPGAYMYAGPWSVDSLMVEAVYSELRAEIFPDQASAFRTDAVACLAARYCFLHVIQRMAGSQ